MTELKLRHARTCCGRPVFLPKSVEVKSWMAGTSPAMTEGYLNIRRVAGMSGEWFNMPSGRREDHRLVTGQGRYADDLDFPHVAHAVMVRSPHAHATIRSIDTTQAKALPGVLAVLTAADALADGLRPIPHATGSSKTGSDVRLAHRDGSERLITQQWPLPLERARFRRRSHRDGGGGNTRASARRRRSRVDRLGAFGGDRSGGRRTQRGSATAL